MNHATYYEQVRDAIERSAECTTSDAQGIIQSWAMRNGYGLMEDEQAVNDQAEQGRKAQVTAHMILNSVNPQLP